MNAPETTDELLERLLLHPRNSDAEPPPGITEDEPGEREVLDPGAGNAD